MASNKYSLRLLISVFFISTLFFSILCVPGSLASERKVVKERLPNGMNVIVEEVDSAPVVAIQMWVQVGSAYETEAEAGLSHVFEHMLFKGTAKRKVGELAKEIESVGGDINAYTSFDNTVYHLVVPSRHFMVGLDVISDSIQNSIFDAEEVEKELEVVLEELRMNRDRPGRNLYKSILGTSFSKHPYGRPVIGYEEVISGLTREKMLEFFSRWYVPNNMTLVIAGDVEAMAVLKEVRASFKNFKKKRVKRVRRAREPKQRELRTSVSALKTAETHFAFGFHIPEIKNSDTYAIDVLEGVLGGSETSRLYKELKTDSGIVHSISAYAMTLKDPGVFLITGVAEAENLSEIISRVREEIIKLGRTGPTEEELSRVRLGLESSFIYSRESMQGIASKLGYYETTLGDLKFEEKYLEGIRGVTSADVREVLHKYLGVDGMNVSVILPEKDGAVFGEPDIRAAIIMGEENARVLEDTIESMSPELAAKGTKRILPNGITLIIKEAHANPTVAFYAAAPGGLRFETSEKNGIGNFTAALLKKGTRRYDNNELAERIEGLAGGISGFSGWNSTGVSAKFLARDFDAGLGLFKEVLTAPTFPTEEIEKRRKDVLAAIKRQEDSLPKYTFKLFLKNLYESHPYGMPTIGTAETVEAFKREDLVAHYKNFFVPERMVLTVVGDVDTEYVAAKIADAFKDFNTETSDLPAPPEEKREKEKKSVGEQKEKAQTHIVVGFLGTSIGHEDSYALRILSDILSGQGGRLFVNLRDRQSLAYSVHAFLKEAKDPGVFAVYIGTAPEKKDQAMEEIFRELRDISTDPVTEAELARAKNSIIGGYEIGLQAVSEQAGSMTNFELYGQGYDFQDEFTRRVDAVTIEDVLRVAKKYLKLKSAIIAVVGPGEGKNKESEKETQRPGLIILP